MKACMLKSVIWDWLRRYIPNVPDGRSYVRVESMRGSRGYEAEEYFDGQLGLKVDVYSFGVVRLIVTLIVIITHTF